MKIKYEKALVKFDKGVLFIYPNSNTVELYHTNVDIKIDNNIITLKALEHKTPMGIHYPGLFDPIYTKEQVDPSEIEHHSFLGFKWTSIKKGIIKLKPLPPKWITIICNNFQIID